MTDVQHRSKQGNGNIGIGLPYPKKRFLGNAEDVIPLPYEPDEEGKSRPYSNPNRDRRNKERDWSLMNTTGDSLDEYAWSLISLAVDSLNLPKSKKKVGRPPADPSDKLKLAILKVWGGYAYRKQHSFNKVYKSFKLINKIIKRTAISSVFTDKKYTPYLESIYRNLANIMIPFENSFAVDSTGMSSEYNSRWVQVRLQHQKHRTFKKLHATTGTHTHIISEIVITDGNASDTILFRGMVERTAERFCIKRICADAAYTSRDNVQAVEDVGAKPFIMPKKNSKAHCKGHYPAWNRMIRLWMDHPQLFNKQYHLRSNVECVFSELKLLFSGITFSRRDTSQTNEILIKVICHNLKVIIGAVFKYNIRPFEDL